MKEAFIKRRIAKRTNKAETRPEGQSQKVERVVGRIDGMKLVERAIKTEIETRTE